MRVRKRGVIFMEKASQLSCLQKGQTATVGRLACQGSIRRRLQDIGLIQGTQVECVGVSPLGDPAAYLIRGAVIALRGSDAADVLVEDIRGPVAFPGLSPAGRPFGTTSE